VGAYVEARALRLAALPDARIAVDELEREPGPAAKFRIVKSAFAAQG
jgi:hypothetical protein